MSYHRALKPTTDATSLAPLGIPLMSGFERRPIWSDPRTPRIVAINAWKAKQEQSQRGALDLTQRRSRKIVDEWPLSIKGLRASNVSKEIEETQPRGHDNLDYSEKRTPQDEAGNKTPKGHKRKTGGDHMSRHEPQPPEEAMPAVLAATGSSRNQWRGIPQKDKELDPHTPLPKATREQKAQKHPDEEKTVATQDLPVQLSTKRKAETQLTPTPSRRGESSSSKDGQQTLSALNSQLKRKAEKQDHPPGRGRIKNPSHEEKQNRKTQENSTAKALSNSGDLRTGVEGADSLGNVCETLATKTNQNKNQKANQDGREASRDKKRCSTPPGQQPRPPKPQRSTNLRCAQCLTKLGKADKDRKCPQGPTWMGFILGSPICDVCERCLLKRSRDHKPFRGF